MVKKGESSKASAKAHDDGLKARVEELEGDMRRLAEALGKLLGEPIASEAHRIVSKKQGK